MRAHLVTMDFSEREGKCRTLERRFVLGIMVCRSKSLKDIAIIKDYNVLG
jgi:hypothetical protein